MTNKPTRIFDFVSLQLAKFPKHDMLATKENGNWKKYSTQSIIDTVNQLSVGLMNVGLGSKDLQVDTQDKVAVIAHNCPEWIILDLACQQIGVILCPIYPTTNAKEISFILNDATIKYVFVSGIEIFEKVSKIRNEVPSLIDIYSFDETPKSKFWKELIIDTNTDYHQLESIKESIHESVCATIIYTSGTTGLPKGVMLSHQNIVSNVINSKNSFPFDDMPTARALSFLPLNHIFERMASYIYISSGISIYYAESMETIGANLLEIKPQIFTTVPRLLEKVYEKIMSKGNELKGIKKVLFNWAVSLGEKYDNINNGSAFYQAQLFIANKLIFNKWRAAIGGNIKFIVTGGAACQERLMKIFNAAQIYVYEGYGPTENSPVISVNCRKKGGQKFGTVGVVIDGQEVKIEADGEICVKGPSVMTGYYNRPDLTSEVLINGWLHTGDIGVLDEGRFLKITDRKKELFKTSGGKYVAPQALENKFKESPFIEQMLVLGDNEKYVGALIVPSFSNIKKWLQQESISVENNHEMIAHAHVIKLYKEIIADYNKHFNPTEQIKKFELLSTEWTIEKGELTPKLSMKRKVIVENYQESIAKLFR